MVKETPEYNNNIDVAATNGSVRVWIISIAKASIVHVRCLGVLPIKSERSSVYTVNNTDPRTDPCGTPDDSGTGSASESLPRTETADHCSDTDTDDI